MGGKGASSLDGGGWHIEARYTDRSGGVTGYNISAEDHHVCDAMSASMRDAHLIAAAPALLEALEAVDSEVLLQGNLKDIVDYALSAAKAWSSPTPKEAG